VSVSDVLCNSKKKQAAGQRRPIKEKRKKSKKEMSQLALADTIPELGDKP
jgi:hypothetical protein